MQLVIISAAAETECLTGRHATPFDEAHGVIPAIQRVAFPVLPPAGVKQPDVLPEVAVTCHSNTVTIR